MDKATRWPVVSKCAEDTVLSYIEAGKQRARACGGRRRASSDGKGTFISRPSRDVRNTMKIARREISAPFCR